MQAAHQPRELAEAALRPGPAGGQDLRFQHDLGIGDVRQIDGHAGSKLHGRAAQSAGNRHLVYSERRAVARAGDLDGMGADADRDRQRLAFLIGPLREQSHIVGGDDIDAGEALFLDDEPIDAAVESELGIARNHHAGRDHRTAIVDRGHRNRQFVEIDILAGENHFARRRGLDVFRRNRLNDGLRELVLDLAIALAAEREHRALARTDEAGDDRHLVPNHLVEEERSLGLVDQGCDVPDVDGLMQVHELAVLAQPVEELPKVLLH